MNDALWLLGRGTGVATLLLLTCSVALGLLRAGGYVQRSMPRFALTEIHRRASLGASLLVLVHVTSLWLDPGAQLRAVDVVVPFVGRNALWWGLGTLAFDLLVVLMVTSLLRGHLPYAVWRGVHWVAYATWPVAFLHGLGSGTDAGTWWLRGVAALCFVTVAAAAAYRLNGLDDPPSREGERGARRLSRRPRSGEPAAAPASDARAQVSPRP